MIKNFSFSLYFLPIVLFAVVGVFAFAPSVDAADARNFNAGKIIDDSVFTNSSSMTVQGIQEFLNSKVVCDTWGVKKSELGGGTRAQWMSARGISAPFRCVTDYRENPSTGQNNYGRSDAPAGSISAAEIIYNYSRQFNINPQVIIATLQKENGMITDEWPTPKQFSEAMGFGCPDNVAPGAPACDPQYGSFSAQVYQAARHFRGYINNSAGWWIPFTTGWNSIAWSPDSACGRGDVYIENRATVALYSYTPYQPNQAAKNAQYGNGDGCSAYGNRNFYMYFTDWFGSVYGDVHMVSSLTLLSSAPGGLYTDGFVEASFVLRNDSDQWKNAGYVAIAVRDEAGNNYDFGGENIILAPHQEYLYRKARNFTAEGKFTFWLTSYRDEAGWSDDYPSAVNGSIRKYTNKIVQHKPTLSVGVGVNNELREGKTSTMGFTVKSNSAYPTNLGYFGLSMRDPQGVNADLPFDTVEALAPGATYSYAKQFTPRKTGDYKAYVASYLDGGWHMNFPVASEATPNQLQASVKPNPTITKGLEVPEKVYVGDSPQVTFKIKNHSSQSVDAGYVAVAVRDPDNQNVDIGGVTLNQLGADQEYTFTGSRKFTKPGIYTAWIVGYKDWWSDSLPTPENDQVKKKITFEVKSNPVLVEGMSLKRIGDTPSIYTARPGDIVEGAFKIKNLSSQQVVVDKSLCYILRGGFKNFDLGCLQVGTLAAGEEKSFVAQRKIDVAGDYRAYFSTFDGVWRDNVSFSRDTGTEPTSLAFTAWANPTLVQGITMTGKSPTTGSFAVKNHANSSISVNKLLCLIVRKEGSSTNYDFGCMDVGILEAGEVKTFNIAKTLPSGSYRAYFSTFDGVWRDNVVFSQEVGNEPRTLQFAVN